MPWNCVPEASLFLRLCHLIPQTGRRERSNDRCYRGIGEKKLSTPPHSPCPWQSGNRVSLGRCGLSPLSTPPHSLSSCQSGDHVSLGRVQPTVVRSAQAHGSRPDIAGQRMEPCVPITMLSCMLGMCAALSTWLGPSPKTPGRHTQQPEGMLVSALVPADRGASRAMQGRQRNETLAVPFHPSRARQGPAEALALPQPRCCAAEPLSMTKHSKGSSLQVPF